MSIRIFEFLLILFVCLLSVLRADADVSVSVRVSGLMDVIYPFPEQTESPAEVKLTPQTNDDSEDVNEILTATASSVESHVPKIGQTIKFGRNVQDADSGNGSGLIEWQVLSISLSGNMLLISKTVPDELMAYGESVINDAADRDRALEWLNGEYYSRVFSEQEKDCFSDRVGLLSWNKYNYFLANGRFERAGIDPGEWYLRPVILLNMAKWPVIPVPEPTKILPDQVIPTNTIPFPDKPEDGKSGSSSVLPILLVLICAVVASSGVLVFISTRGKRKKNNKGRRSEHGFGFTWDTVSVTDSNTAILGKNGFYHCAGCIGQGKRSYQEDSLWYSQSASLGSAVCAVISDGMGGMENGAESSAIAIDAFKTNVQNIRTDQDIPSALWQISNTANDAVFTRNSEKGMNGGSTLICVFITENMLYWISVGDSRIFLARDGMLASVNQEHELEAQLYNRLADGDLELGDIRETQYKELRKLTSNLGRRTIPLIDQNFIPYRLAKGDKLLLCSDGVSDTLSENELLSCLKDPDPDVNCDRISSMIKAKDKKGQDNFSAIVVSVRTENGK